jgi:hypothetical protein
MTPPLFPFIPPFGGGTGRGRGRGGRGRATAYMPSVASNEKIFRTVFKKSAATRKTKFLTGVELRL